MTDTTVCLSGAAAAALLDSPEFQTGWDTLFARCPWATVFQSRRFHATWFGVYGARFEPVVVARGAPTPNALLLLARERATGRVAHVGDHHAEYQTWLAEADDTTFVESALDVVARELGPPSLRLTYVPPGAPLGWTEAGRWAARTVARVERRGLIALGEDNEATTSLTKSRYRYRLRKLEAAGGMRFRQLQSAAELAPVLDALIATCDFRQGAVNDSTPFGSDPLKRPFHVAMMDVPGLLHTTVLEAGSELVSAQMNWLDGNRVVLGLLAHGPRFAKLSPGTLHIFLLAKMAREQGFAELDLTPSGEYKDRFASHHDEARMVTVHFSAASAARAKVRTVAAAVAKSGLRRASMDPAETVDRARALAERVRRVTPAAVARKVMRRVGTHTDELRVYTFDLSAGAAAPDASAPDASAPDASALRVDDLGDLLQLRPDRDQHTTQRDFLHAALRRLEDGQHVYTHAAEGRLAHYGWLVAGETVSHLSEVDAELALLPDSVTLYDFYTDPAFRGRGLYRASLTRMLADARATGASLAYITVLADNVASRKVIERIGFTYRGSLFRRVGRSGAESWSTVEPSAVAAPAPTP